MNRAQYRAARQLVRANGRAALRWIAPSAAVVMVRLLALQKATDPLAALAHDRQTLPLTQRQWKQWRLATWLEATPAQ